MSTRRQHHFSSRRLSLSSQATQRRCGSAKTTPGVPPRWGRGVYLTWSGVLTPGSLEGSRPGGHMRLVKRRGVRLAMVTSTRRLPHQRRLGRGRRGGLLVAGGSSESEHCHTVYRRRHDNPGGVARPVSMRSAASVHHTGHHHLQNYCVTKAVTHPVKPSGQRCSVLRSVQASPRLRGAAGSLSR
ncbi:hypothetical protein E2C01_064933 [Portunus trituberculatus]|uniref:Uncharacterized protein n=1 Tax=Portunus trituberculatus TaxID=210409 RepID=A0A5B7HPR4_PORTR|nr:hypothetical protein [Portunus trituberculatus]